MATTQAKTGMSVFDAVRTVLAVREFKQDPIPDETVRRIVEAAHLTASSMNGQPWHFVVVEDRDTLTRLGRAVRTGPYIAQAPMAVAVAIDDSPYAVSDASRAIQSMILTAWAEGAGSNWAGFGGLHDVNKVLGIPEQLDMLAVVPFGYPLHPHVGEQKDRKPFGEVVSLERYGQPYQ